MKKELHALWTTTSVLGIALLFCQITSLSIIIVECHFAELVDLLYSDRICSLEVTWFWRILS